MDNFDKMTRLEVLAIKLKALKKEHRELDIKISGLVELSSSDQFTCTIAEKK